MRTTPGARHLRQILTPLALAGAIQAEFPKHTLGNTQVRDLPKSENGQSYRLMVGLPYTYGASPDKKYPVLYLCDGYWDFTLVNGMYGNLLYDKAIPEFIIVGFSYQGDHPDYESLRAYDLTPAPHPVHDPKGLATGHGPDFLKVIQKQILPYVQKEFRVDTTFRVLGGSSLGGLFAVTAMLETPGLFQGFIAPSPAIEVAAPWVWSREGAYAKQHKSMPARIFLSVGGEEPASFRNAVSQLRDTLLARKYQGLSLQWRVVDGERHAGTKAESYNRGLRYVFAPLAPQPSEK